MIDIRVSRVGRRFVEVDDIFISITVWSEDDSSVEVDEAFSRRMSMIPST